MSATAIPATRVPLNAYQDIPAARAVRPNVALLSALAEARAFGVPAYAVAAVAEISPALLSMIARGRVRATEVNALAIARALGREADELFPGVARERDGRPARLSRAGRRWTTGSAPAARNDREGANDP